MRMWPKREQQSDRELLLEILLKLENLAEGVVIMDQDVTALVAAVTQETTVNQSAITLINGIAAQIAAAIAAAGSLSAGDRAALQSTVASITSNASSLSAAVVANTPATPGPVSQTARP